MGDKFHHLSVDNFISNGLLSVSLAQPLQQENPLFSLGNLTVAHHYDSNRKKYR